MKIRSLLFVPIAAALAIATGCPGEAVDDAGSEPSVSPGVEPEDAGASPEVDAGSEDAGTPPVDAGDTDAGTPPVDAGDTDAGTPPVDAGDTDAGTPPVDAGDPDAGTPPVDAGDPDAGTPPVDAGDPDGGTPPVDAGDDGGIIVVDGGAPDAGAPDAGAPDAGAPDAGAPDAGDPDAGAPDAGTPDAGAPDAGTPDAGAPDAGDPDAGAPDAGQPVLGSCASPIEAGDGFTLTGDITDYESTFDETDPSCRAANNNIAGRDVVMVVDLLAGQFVRVEETGALDAVIRIQPGQCDEAAPCAAATDTPEVASYIATTDETVTLIVSAWSGSPFSTAFEIAVSVGNPEDCTVAGDEDNNGVADCDDSACFGFVGICETELNCSDGEDNDGDTDVDCLDTDCVGTAECAPAAGVYEAFTSVEFDLNGQMIILTPTGTNGDYGFVALPSLGLEPTGAGTVASVSMVLGDDDAEEYILSQSYNFGPFQTDSVFVGSNGSITIDGPDTTASFSASSFFAFARLAGLDEDLDPGDGGTIIVDEYADHLVVTYTDVPSYSQPTNLQTFQLVLQPSGTMAILYEDIQVDPGLTFYVGLSFGNPSGLAVFPDEVDFYVPPNVVTINEVSTRNPTSNTFEFIELHGVGGASLDGFQVVHTDGDDGSTLFSVSLDGFTMPADGLFVIGAPGVPNLDLDFSDVAISALQTGPDSIEVLGPGGLVADAMSYGFAAVSVNNRGEGASIVGFDTAWNSSMGRLPDGADTDDNATDFIFALFSSPGQPNFRAQPSPNDYLRVSAAVSGDLVAPLTIPDNDPTGVTVTMTNGAAQGVIDALAVGIKIRHTFIGDLRLTLTSPAGTSAVLHNRSGSSADNIFTVYDLETASADGLAGFVGETLDPTGTWTLTVIDGGIGDVGTIEDWSLFIDFAP